MTDITTDTIHTVEAASVATLRRVALVLDKPIGRPTEAFNWRNIIRIKYILKAYFEFLVTNTQNSISGARLR